MVINKLVYLTAAMTVWSLHAQAGAAPVSYARMAPLAQYLYANRASEVALARTAAAASISAHATVLTLGRHGYETAVKGTNGFVCLVQRSWANDFDRGDFWNPRIRTPQCWNAAAARSLLQDYLNRTRWALSGVSTNEMAARTKAEFASHQVGPPAPGSMVYMLSKHQYIHDPSPASGPSNWYPHVMFFMPATDGSPWGANAPGGPMFSDTSHAEPITTYFLVAPNWSDGTPGPSLTASGVPQIHHH
jgi:hypothetical protein